MPDPNFNGTKLAILSNKAQRRKYRTLEAYKKEMSRRGKLGGRGKKKISTGRKKK